MSDISTQTQYTDLVLSIQNLWNMRSFYLEFKENEKLQPLVREIACSQLPRELEAYLPCSEEITKRLEIFKIVEKYDK